MTHSPVQPKQIVATIKIIPYAVQEVTVRAAESIAQGSHPVVCVDVLPSRTVGMILSGSRSIREKLVNDFAPLRSRVERLGSSVGRIDFVALEEEPDEAALVSMLADQLAAGIRMILLAGETAIMDAQDILPRAGGYVESVGAPVDPGNLLMLAYIGDVPVVGAPGCARSRKTNIVDWILPRLLAGDCLTRRDIVALGHGGLLQDISERGMPRDIREGESEQNSESVLGVK